MAYQNGRKNNRRFKNNKNRRGGRKYNGFDEENISPQQRRQFTNKYETHMQKAKDLQRTDRIEAENHFQHADHYYRMSQLGLDKKPKQEANEAANEEAEGNNAETTTPEENAKTAIAAEAAKDDKASQEVPEEIAAAPKDEIAGLSFMQNPS